MSQPVIFDGATRAKLLRAGLNLNDTAYILQGTDDPTSVAQNAPQGSIYMMTGSSGGRVFKKQDAGNTTNWEEIGSGSSSGINYILNPDADAGTSGWSTYADVAGVVPVDGSGGSPVVTLTRTTSSPLRGSGSFLITKDAANRQGEGASYAFTIDNADKSKKLSVSFDLEVASGTFVVGDSSDIRVFIYDVTNASLIYPSTYTLPSAPGKFQATWDASTSTSYRLILHVATTSASAYTLKFDNVNVGPQQIIFGPAMSDFIDYGATVIGATTTAPTKPTMTIDKMFGRRVGDSLELQITYRGAGAGAPAAGSGTYLFSLPSGLSMDTTKITASTSINNDQFDNATAIGHGALAQPGAQECQLIAFAYNSTQFYLKQIIKADTTGTTLSAEGGNAFGSGSTPSIATSNLAFSLFVTVPIQGWSTNVVSSISRTFQISSYLVNGTRVTTTPAALGEYRSRSKTTVTSNTYADNAPTTAPTAANGIKLDSANYASAQSAGDISLWNIFVGKNKHVKLEWYRTTGRTGEAYPDFFVSNSTDAHGVNWSYDPTTGVVTVDAGTNILTTNTTRLAVRDSSNTGYSTAYFDVIVSENALTVQQEQIQDYAYVAGSTGVGAVLSNVRGANASAQVGTSATPAFSANNGGSITINATGLYEVTIRDIRYVSSGAAAVRINSTAAPSVTQKYDPTVQIIYANFINGNGEQTVSQTSYLKAGDVVRHVCTSDANWGDGNNSSMLLVKRIL